MAVVMAVTTKEVMAVVMMDMVVAVTITMAVAMEDMAVMIMLATPTMTTAAMGDSMGALETVVVQGVPVVAKVQVAVTAVVNSAVAAADVNKGISHIKYV
uniref:Putative secreted protein n=1 Tax=Xenopsylla cheopis TaxID=163159 RepID=A0A6M2DZ87_XENCH